MGNRGLCALNEEAGSVGDKMADDRIFIADCISKRRFRSGKAQYYVKWKGCPSSYNTWEPEENILDPGLILEFEARLAEASSKGKKPGRKPKLLKLKAVDFKGRPFENKQKDEKHITHTKPAWHGRTGNIPEAEKTGYSAEPKDVYSDQMSSSGLDVNNNATVEGPREDKWKVPRKPKSLFLEQSIRENSTCSSNVPQVPDTPSPFSAFGKADSPLMGMVPSPTYGQNCEFDSAKFRNGDYLVAPTMCARMNDEQDRKITGAKLTGIDFSNKISTASDGNSVKLGKFALLRKYRNSLEESDPVTTTDVTVEGVTVTVRESDRPQGFFGPSAPKPWCIV